MSIIPTDYASILRSMEPPGPTAYSDAPPRNGVQFKGDVRFSGPDLGSRNDAQSVQATPNTVPVKHYVIIDASHRNWVSQPNPYSNVVYSFGSQSTGGYSPPVYSNNPFIPTFGSDANGNLNTQPGAPNLIGWYLSSVFYPAYNSSRPKGNFIAYDTGYTINPSGLGFGSVFLPSNVQSIRLVRAVLPQRQFLTVPVLVDSAATASDIAAYGPGGTVQYVVGKSHSSFSTYPYLLFYLNEYQGKYVGGNEAMRRSFSVMTLKTRTQTDFDLDIGVQYYDYEPWNAEAMTFQSPLTTLKQLQISVTDPIGLGFAQNDSLSVTLVQTDPHKLFLQFFTGTTQYFNSNELRVGDRVIFDGATLSNIAKATSITTNSDKVSVANALGDVAFPVLQLLDYVLDPNTGTFVARTTSTARTTSYTTSYNGFVIPNFLTSNSTGDVKPLYANAADPGNYNVFTFPIQYNINPVQYISNLPFMNISLQPTYTLELTCLEPDTGVLGGRITQ